ncbi:MAG: TIGR01777 family oxidoreductase [Desulfosalsimonadaceae bacterium]
MKTNLFQKQSRINAPVETVFNWHARPGAIERLSPPWDPLTIVRGTGGIEVGAEVFMRLKAGPLSVGWHARHTHFEENRMFRDIQVKGPFAKWEHTHQFEPDGSGGCILKDSIEYALPFHPISTALMKPFVEKKLNGIFTYRHNTTIADIAAHQRANLIQPLNILVSGASGLLGSVLIPFLTTGGHRVMQLVRRQPDKTKGEIFWNPSAGKLNLDAAGKIDAVIHLSGENIGEGRWTLAKKRRIIDSRTKTTGLIAETIARMKTPPKVFLCASAIGYYGDRGDALLDESDISGRDFISDVCKQWEASANPAIQAGIRTVNLRIGIVFSPQGGALGKLLPPFRMGIGGKIASGRQYMSWISIDDAVGAIHHTMLHDQITGPVNLVSPNPATNLEFTRTLARVLSRPAYFTVPKMAIEAVFGEMGRETILSSTRVRPFVLETTGYPYRHPDLETALRHLLGKTGRNGLFANQLPSSFNGVR